MPWSGRVVSSSTVPDGLLYGPSRAEVLDQFEHLAVAREHERDEASYPLSAGAVGQQSKQRRAEAAPLVVVRDRDRDLGRLGIARPAHEPSHPDERSVCTDGDERLVVVVVDVGQVAQHRSGEPLHRREEASVARLLRQSLEARTQGLGILRTDRPHGGARSVTQRYEELTRARTRRGRRAHSSRPPHHPCVASSS